MAKFTEAYGVQEGYSDKGKLNLFEWMLIEYDDCVKSIGDCQDMLKNCLELPIHAGDCTSQNYTCSLCLIETILSEYYDYCKTFKN